MGVMPLGLSSSCPNIKKSAMNEGWTGGVCGLEVQTHFTKVGFSALKIHLQCSGVAMQCTFLYFIYICTFTSETINHKPNSDANGAALLEEASRFNTLLLHHYEPILKCLDNQWMDCLHSLRGL